MLSRKDLLREVNYYNYKYCKRGSVELDIMRACGGCQVVLRSKKNKKGEYMNKYLGSGVSSITSGYCSSRETLIDLDIQDYCDLLKEKIQDYNRIGRKYEK